MPTSSCRRIWYWFSVKQGRGQNDARYEHDGFAMSISSTRMYARVVVLVIRLLRLGTMPGSKGVKAGAGIVSKPMIWSTAVNMSVS